MIKKIRKQASGFSSSFSRHDWDLFAEPIGLNFKGKTKVGTYFGLFLTILIVLLMTTYSFYMLLKVFSKDNPNITNQVQVG